MLTLNDPDLLHNQCLIGGNWQDADSGATDDVINPATGDILGRVARAGSAETERAIAAAEQALPDWRARTAKDRSAALRRWYDLMLENQEDLARLMTAEQGKPLAESRGEIAFAASFLEWFAEEARRVYGDVIPAPNPDNRLMVVKQPVGVCAAITPWNFPSAMIARKAGPALAAGCTIVIKPAGQTPYSALAMAALAERAGIPAGVVNVVMGDSRAIGQVITASPVVRKLTFTGSTGVGKQLMADCAPTMKRVSMELGGNAPFIVFEDADLDRAADALMVAKYRNGGQTCVCANRVFVQHSVQEAFAEKLAERVGALKVGAGDAEGTDVGPLIDANAVAKVRRQLDDAVAQGGRILIGGESLGGNYLAPAVVSNAHTDMLCFREETFGPMAPLFSFDTEEEAIQLANDTEFGLAAYFFTRDLARTWRVSEALDYGMVGINNGHVSTCEAPFGGVKDSGQGREGSHYGIDDYLDIKYLCMTVS